MINCTQNFKLIIFNDAVCTNKSLVISINTFSKKMICVKHLTLLWQEMNYLNKRFTHILFLINVFIYIIKCLLAHTASLKNIRLKFCVQFIMGKNWLVTNSHETL